MDLDLAKTFLAVVETGSFVEAADKVFVTQSTVSMRIRTLEELLGKPLFIRSKAGASLTPAGDQFHKHAIAFVRVWEQARLEVALPQGLQAALTVGGQYSLWDGFLLDWLTRMRRKAPEIALRAQIGDSETLMQHLVAGTLDIGVMYTPTSRPGIELELLFEEELILVTAESGRKPKTLKNYVYVDWGPEFLADHGLNFPDLSTPSLYMELGSLSLKYLLENKASGYFPKRLAEPHIESGKLARIAGTPVFHYPAYAVYAASSDPVLMAMALRALRHVAKTASET